MKGIYKITSPTGKIYIGQAVNLDNRRKDYESYNCKAQRYLYSSLKKYGFEQHLFEIIIEGEFTLEELNRLEVKYIKEFNSFRGWTKMGMNLTTGGDNCERYEGSKKLISESLKKYHSEIGHSEETKARIANSLRGMKQSLETIEKRNRSRKETLIKMAHAKPKSLYNRNKKKDKNNLIRQQKEIRNQQIVGDIKSGIRQDIIAEKYNLSPSVITQLKKKYNIQVETNIRRGQNNNFSKLTEQQVREIKKMLQDRVRHREIAELYNVTVRTIKAIKSGQNWSHITIEDGM